MSLSKFESLAKEALEEIAIILSALTPLGPPTDLFSLLSLSKEVYLKPSWSYVFSQVFLDKFDISAPVRRLGNKSQHTGPLARELVKRFETLRRFKHEYVKNGRICIDIDGAETMRTDLWRAYIMFLENDGKNAAQLVQYAAVDAFAVSYISRHGPLQKSAAANYGYPPDTEANSLAIELLWHTEKERIPHETLSQRRKIATALLQFFAFPSEYPSTLGPITMATNPLITSSPDSIHSEPPSLVGWPVSRPCVIPDYFGRTLTLVQPPIAQAALRSSSIRYRAFTPEMMHRFQGEGLTVAEIQAYHAQPDGLGLVDLDEDSRTPGSMGSRRFDEDWLRLFNCYDPRSRVRMRNPVFKPGTLQGKWTGDQFSVDISHIVGKKGQPILNYDIRNYTTELELREYHQHSKNAVIPFNDVNVRGNDGVLGAWFPFEMSLVESSDQTNIAVSVDCISSQYQRYNPTDASPRDNLSQDPEAPYGDGVWDIILVGNLKGSATTYPEYYGRVRSWDGLVVIVYGDSAVDIRNRNVLYGYLRGHNHFVGRWRDCLTPIANQQDMWSGSWTMTRGL